MPTTPTVTNAGDLIARDVLVAHNVDLETAASHAGIGERELRNVFDRGHPVSPDTAIRLELAFGIDAEELLVLSARADAARMRARAGDYNVPAYTPPAEA